jgi:hypothetical protein
MKDYFIDAIGMTFIIAILRFLIYRSGIFILFFLVGCGHGDGFICQHDFPFISAFFVWGTFAFYWWKQALKNICKTCMDACRHNKK